MSEKKQKLELTWIGKDKQPVLEPRILIEDPEKSYGDKTAENMLIFGDNLPGLAKCLAPTLPFYKYPLTKSG
jgi:adenine-specific DNA-methyltransferase